MNRPAAWLCLALAALAACATRQQPVEPSADVEPGPIALRDPGGRLLANATVAGDAGLRVRVEAAGLVAGTYAVHLHEAGRCDPPDFASAGAHWNPAGREHGRLNPLGPHLGDLPNLTVGTDGAGSIAFAIPAASLGDGGRALADRDGAALIVHAGADDYRTDPGGSSGARLACGVVVAPR